MRDDPTIQTYDKYASVYDEEVIEFWNDFPLEFIDKLVSSSPGKRVLNLGSGSGRDAVLLRDRGLEVVCVDASKSMIDMTTKLGFESQHMAFADIDFPANSFDAVWAYTSLIHIPKVEAGKVIQKVHHLLKPGGIFAIGVIEGTTAGMKERDTMPGAARYFKNYTKDELKRMVESCGFKFLYENNYQPHKSVYLNHLYVRAN